MSPATANSSTIFPKIEADKTSSTGTDTTKKNTPQPGITAGVALKEIMVGAKVNQVSGEREHQGRVSFLAVHHQRNSKRYPDLWHGSSGRNI